MRHRLNAFWGLLLCLVIPALLTAGCSTLSYTTDWSTETQIIAAVTVVVLEREDVVAHEDLLKADGYLAELESVLEATTGSELKDGIGSLLTTAIDEIAEEEDAPAIRAVISLLLANVAIDDTTLNAKEIGVALNIVRGFRLGITLVHYRS